jgi:hypothetical protein
LEIAAELMGRSHKLTISASEFSGMEWPIKQMGGNAITYPRQREYARTAIQELSHGAEERTIYSHTGWRELINGWTYLHGAGAIGSAGVISGIDIRLVSQIRLFELQLPVNEEVLRSAVRASLALIDLAPPTVSFPLLAATYRAVFGNTDFAIHLAGETGAFKSELAALHQQHFGPGMNRQNLPGSWTSTGNAVEVLTFYTKDALFVIDDFAPQGSHADVDRYHAAADRLFRSAGNGAGRSRLDANANLRETRAPRALILSTGEDVPRGHSIRARLLTLELTKNRIDSDALTKRQKDAADGLYALSMGAFIQHVAGHYPALQAPLQEKCGQRQRDAYGKLIHARTPVIVANLQAAFELFLEFAEAHAVVGTCEAEALRDRCWSALLEVAVAQRWHQENSNPAERFIEILRSLLTSGRIHFESRDGGDTRWIARILGLEERRESKMESARKLRGMDHQRRNLSQFNLGVHRGTSRWRATGGAPGRI